MDDFLLPPPAELSDCIVELHFLKEESRLLDDKALVEFIMEVTSDLELTMDTEEALAYFFNTSSLSNRYREVLENCYVILKNYLCVGLDGEIYQTLLVEK